MDDKLLSQIKDLIEFLNARAKEYDESHPTISDQEWDSKYFELVKFNNYSTHTEGQQERGTLSTGTRPIENYLLAIATFFKILVNALFPI